MSILRRGTVSKTTSLSLSTMLRRRLVNGWRLSAGRQRRQFTDVVKEFAGQHVLKANPKIVEFLQANGRLLGHGSLNHSYPHCWRCKNPVIFRATEQWFVSMDTNELRKEALAEIERVRWIPAYGRDRINGMIENRPDWCLSRNVCGGCRFPVFLHGVPVCAGRSDCD